MKSPEMTASPSLHTGPPVPPLPGKPQLRHMGESTAAKAPRRGPQGRPPPTALLRAPPPPPLLRGVQWLHAKARLCALAAPPCKATRGRAARARRCTRLAPVAPGAPRAPAWIAPHGHSLRPLSATAVAQLPLPAAPLSGFQKESPLPGQSAKASSSPRRLP